MGWWVSVRVNGCADVTRKESIYQTWILFYIFSIFLVVFSGTQFCEFFI